MVSKIAKIAPLLYPGFVFFYVGGCLKFEGARSGLITLDLCGVNLSFPAFR